MVVAAAAFVGGTVVGGMGPRAEVREARAELLDLQRRYAAAGGAGSDLASMLARGLGTAAVAPSAPEPTPSDAEPEPIRVAGTAPESEPARAEDDAPLDEVEEPDGEERFEDVADALDLRARQARAALFEATDATPDQIARVEDRLDAMNAELEDIALRLTEDARAEGQLNRSITMAYAADALNTLVAAEEGLASVFDGDPGLLDGDLLDPTAFVDARVLEPIQGLDEQGLLP